MEVGGKLNAAATMPSGKNPGTHWVDPRDYMNVLEESSLRLSEFEPRKLPSKSAIR
jgi:hypothetical protein